MKSLDANDPSTLLLARARSSSGDQTSVGKKDTPGKDSYLDENDEEDDETSNLLRTDEINNCRQIFKKYQSSVNFGRISLWDLRKALRELEIQPAEDELFKIIESIQEQEMKPVSPSAFPHDIQVKKLPLFTLQKTGTIDFEQFLSIVVSQKKQDRPIHDNETLSAFVAMGGNSDRTGAIQTEKLTAACQEFGLTIDIDALIREVDDDGNGTVDFDEFTMMMSTSKFEEDDDYHAHDMDYYEKNLRRLDDAGGADHQVVDEEQALSPEDEQESN